MSITIKSASSSTADLLLTSHAEETLSEELRQLNISHGDTSALCCSAKSYSHRLQSCANIKAFTALICILACVNGAISASYLPSVITTMEKEFHLGSSMSGLIVTSYEVGATIAVIFISYLGHSRHIPAILGCGALVIAGGTCLFSLPHFIAKPYSLELQDNLNSTSNVSGCNTVSENHQNCTGTNAYSGNTVSISIFMVAQTLIGVGSAPILTLGLAYVDNHVCKKKSPQYIAFIYSASALGAVLGFGCGAAILDVYVDFLSFPAEKLHLTPQDSRWIGAWWAGFLLLGTGVFLVSPPLFFFPKVLLKERLKIIQAQLADKATAAGTELDMAAQSDSQLYTDERAAVSNNIKDLPKALLKLIRNPVYMLINAGTLFEMALITGFLTFIPKYFETQFGLPSTLANLYTGALAIPGAVFGLIAMGIILKKFKLQLQGAMQLTLILNLVTLACCCLLFFFGCNNLLVAGVTIPYIKTETLGERMNVNLTHSCNQQCVCPDTNYAPVCGSNRITYFSACHAGCGPYAMSKMASGSSLSSPSGVSHIEGCNCVRERPENSSVEISDTITSGACSTDCAMLIPFMLTLLVVSFVIAGAKTPVTAITLRCIDKDMRSFALGIQVVIVRVLAFIPAPILYGLIIDTTCSYWKYDCGERLQCLMYDVEQYRFKFAALTSSLHVLSMSTFLATWYLVRRNASAKHNFQQDPKT